MRAVNHAVTGAVIAAAVPSPALGLPLALASHLVLDAIPHHGGMKTSSRMFLYTLAADAALASAVMLSIILLQPEHWVVPVAGALLAMAPDLMWLPGWLREIRGGRLENASKNPLMQLHSRVQWYQRPAGIVIEAAWFPLMYVLLISLPGSLD